MKHSERFLMNQGITIRMGAAHHDLTAGSFHIDLSTASKTERYETRRTIIEHLKATGYFGRREQRKALYRQRGKADA